MAASSYFKPTAACGSSPGGPDTGRTPGGCWTPGTGRRGRPTPQRSRSPATTACTWSTPMAATGGGSSGSLPANRSGTRPLGSRRCGPCACGEHAGDRADAGIDGVPPGVPEYTARPRRLTMLRTVRYAVALIVAALVLVVSAPAFAKTNPFCARLGHRIQASAGAQMFCFGLRRTGAAWRLAPLAPTSFGTNVNAADPAEDISPAGARAYGQSETSIAGSGPYVVEAWNDATSLVSPCPSPRHKEEGTGVGVSGNAAASFVDVGGPPNDCRTLILFGDPSVEAWHTAAAGDVFYVSSLYDRPDGTGRSFLAVNACRATGTGSSPRLTCGQPIKIAESTQCETEDGTQFCSFLDKEFLAIDRARGRLYVSYTDFGLTGGKTNGEIDLAVCDIGTSSGRTGPAGGS